MNTAHTLPHRTDWLEKARSHMRVIEHSRMAPPLRRALSRLVLPDPYHRTGRSPDGREVVFIHVPKTAGTSIAQALGVCPGHIPVSRYIARDPDRFARAFSFGFVRNPWSRAHSSFNYLRSAIGLNTSPDVRWSEEHLASYDTFEAFVLALRDKSTRRKILRWRHFRAQADWMYVPGRQDCAISFIGRFEHLHADTAACAGILGTTVSLPHMRKARTYRTERYTPQMVSIIADLYQRDVDLFGYTPPEVA